MWRSFDRAVKTPTFRSWGLASPYLRYQPNKLCYQKVKYTHQSTLSISWHRGEKCRIQRFMIYSLHYLKRPWMKKPALSVTNYVNVWGRSRVLAFASHDISWNVFRHNNFETFIFNTNFQSSLEKPLSHKIIKSNTNLKPLSSWCQDNGSVNIFYWNWNTGCFMMWERKGMKIIRTKDKLKPTHDLACTSRMRKTISPGQWQSWTAVSPLLGQKVCLIQLAKSPQVTDQKLQIILSITLKDI